MTCPNGRIVRHKSATSWHTIECLNIRFSLSVQQKIILVQIPCLKKTAGAVIRTERCVSGATHIWIPPELERIYDTYRKNPLQFLKYLSSLVKKARSFPPRYSGSPSKLLRDSLLRFCMAFCKIVTHSCLSTSSSTLMGYK